jgi:hypothetical protein
MIFLERVAEPALWFLGEWSLRWAALIVALAALLLVCRPRRAGTRHLACVAVFCAGLLLPLVPRWGPGWKAGPRPAEPEPGPVLRPAPRVTVPREAPAEDREIGRIQEVPKEPPPREAEEAPAAPAVSGPSWGVRQWVVLGLSLAWAGGALVLLVRLGGGVLLLGRWRRQAREAGKEDAELFGACCDEMGLRGRARLGIHPHILSPITLGLFRPTVLVPAGWADLSREARRGCLLHELAHLARRDDWWGLLFEMARAVFFFHLPLHWLLARIARERELLCDERAVSLGVDPRDYARVLLDFARRPGRHVLVGLGLASPLCLGRGHMVRARIDHLLEDDMERKLKPLSWSWALTLGLGVIAGGLGVGSVRLLARAAEEPAAPPPAASAKEKEEEARTPKLPREVLRYGGKSFGQWRADLLTELKPELRIDGIKALARFGANGYGTEAAEAILEVVRGYDMRPAVIGHGLVVSTPVFGEEDSNVVEVASGAIQKIGGPAVPVLLKGLEGDNENVRLFVIEVLRNHLFREGKEKIGRALLRLVRETRDPEVHRVLIWPLQMYGEAKDVVPVLTTALQDKDARMRQSAASAIGEFGKAARPAIPSLVKLAEDPLVDRGTVYRALEAADADAKVVLPILVKAVKEGDRNQVAAAAHYLGKLGPRAEPAVPVLVARLKSIPRPDNAWSQIVAALGEIGPGAREAVPVLEGFLNPKWNTNEVLAALKKIRGEDK